VSTVSYVVNALLLRAGLTAPQFDITELDSITREVRSMYVSQLSSTRSVLEMLGACYGFTFCGGDMLYFRVRGAAPVATIPWDDLGADGDADRLPMRQANELEVPAQIAFTYDNVENDYQPDTQFSDRVLSTQTSVESVQVPLGFTASEAKAIADSLLLDKIIGMTTSTIAVGRAYSHLQPGDVVLVLDEDGNTWRMLILKIVDAGGVRKCELRLDDATIWTQPGISAAGTQGQTVVLAPPDTTLALLDIPMLSDSEDRAGIYVAVCGATNAFDEPAPWSASGVYESMDDTSYSLKASINTRTPIGTCTTTLGGWSLGNIFDETNTVTVEISTDDTLSSYTRDEILTGSAPGYLVGDELLYARTATMTGAGIYVLSGLLRGRRGTEWAMNDHAADERFVRLSTSGMAFLPLDAADLAGERFYKGVASGQRLSEVIADTITPLGVTLEPYSPVDARVDRSASDHVISWKRRSRLSCRLTGALPISCPLGEAAESYEVDIFIGSAEATAGTPVLRTITASSQSCTYTSAQRTTDGTGSSVVYMRVYQLSAVVGRGTPLITSA